MTSLIEKIKIKLTWEPIIRALIQGYLGFALAGLLVFKVFEELDTKILIIHIFFTVICFIVPAALSIFFFKKMSKFSNQQFNTKFGALYKNQRLNSRASTTHLWYTPLYFFGRFLLTFTIVYFTQFPLSQFWAYTYTTLLLTSFTISQCPFDLPILNRMCSLNYTCTLLSSYYIVLMSDIVLDLEVREDIGWGFVGMLLAFIGFNFIVLFSKMGKMMF